MYVHFGLQHVHWVRLFATRTRSTRARAQCSQCSLSLSQSFSLSLTLCQSVALTLYLTIALTFSVTVSHSHSLAPLTRHTFAQSTLNPRSGRAVSGSALHLLAYEYIVRAHCGIHINKVSAIKVPPFDNQHNE